MNVVYATVERNFSSSLLVPRATLFEEIGWSDLEGKPQWENTCAIRLSLALIKSGINVPGRIAIRSGPHKGKLIEPGQARLSKILSQRSFFGAPEKTKRGAQALVAGRRGIVSFFHIDPSVQTPQGHIDIVAPARNQLDCGTSCFWSAKETWFWPLR